MTLDAEARDQERCSPHEVAFAVLHTLGELLEYEDADRNETDRQDGRKSADNDHLVMLSRLPTHYAWIASHCAQSVRVRYALEWRYDGYYGRDQEKYEDRPHKTNQAASSPQAISQEKSHEHNVDDDDGHQTEQNHQHFRREH